MTANVESRKTHEILMSMADLTTSVFQSPRYDITRPFELLRGGADASVTDKNGDGAFHYLVQSGVFRDRSRRPKSRIFSRHWGPPPDADMTMERLIHELQAAGADVNLQNKLGETSLHIMCRKVSAEDRMNEKLFESLIQAGADPNLRDNKGETAAFSLFLNGRFGFRPTKESNEHMVQLVLRLGARFDLRDCHGQTVVHSLLSRKSNLTLAELLIEHGIDPSAVDNEGNTLWHAVADRIAGNSGEPKGSIRLLLRLNVDPQKPNNSGRNPLHCLSSLLAPRLDFGRLEIFPSCIPDISTTAFDHVLQLYLERGYNLDSPDSSGVTPLHLACTFSQHQTRELLRAGADLQKSTHEGLTALHLSARCRQANILGILLEFARERELDAAAVNRPSTSVHEFVNASDSRGRPALYYACASGRPESVTLLLGAGAFVQSDTYDGSVWQACVEFEVEELNWAASPTPSNAPPATVGGVLMDDKKRPKLTRRSAFPTERLDSVLDLLIQRQDSVEKTAAFIDEAISDAVARQLDYTVECLVQARRSLYEISRPEMPHASATLDASTSACLARRKAVGHAEELVTTPEALRTEFERLMCLRRYDLVQNLILKHGWGELNYNGNTFVHDLAENGFLSILRGLGSLVKELLERLEDIEWCDRQKLESSKAAYINLLPDTITGPRGLGSTQPLLLAACRSEQPNMEVVRFLVEEIGCDVNVQGYLRVPIPAGPNAPRGHGIYKHETPAHMLFRGKPFWWQTSQALPYLALDHRASLEIRDCFHSTPLAVAAAHIGRPTFDRRAFDKLLELGADATAVDLTWASDSAEMTKVLLSHGAALKPAAFLAAVRTRNCDVLNILISRGGDVNARPTGMDGEDRQTRRPAPIYIETSAPRPVIAPTTGFARHLLGRPLRASRDVETFATPGPFVPEGEMYPLDLAAHLYARQPELDEHIQLRGPHPDEVPYMWPLPADELERVMETLVAGGADVMAEYEHPGGVRTTIKDRIVLRGAEHGFIRLGRPQRARKILEICRTTYEGVL